jgi:hypothetical protein
MHAGIRHNLAGWFDERVTAPFSLETAPDALLPSLLVGRQVQPLSIQPRKYQRAAIPSHRSLTVGKKLYCGNLSYNTSSSDLDQMFSQFGRVQSAEVVMDRDTGRSKGFGFVEMSSDAEAAAAIEGLNLKELDGRSLTVNEARPRPERGGGGRGGRSGGGRRGGY